MAQKEKLAHLNEKIELADVLDSWHSKLIFFDQLIVLLNDKPQNLLFYFSSSEFKQQCFLEILLGKKKRFVS